MTRSLTGSLYRHTTNEFHAYIFAIHGYFYWQAWAVARAVCTNGDTIVEIGANIGTETIGFADIVGKQGTVHAFEPLPTNVDILNNILALNNLKHVIVHPKSVGALCELVWFRCPEVDQATGVGYITTSDSIQPSGVIPVECVTLDSLSVILNKVKLIFIDAEGSEMNILLGAKNLINDARPYIILEASSKLLGRAGFTITDLRSVLSVLNYSIYKLGKIGVSKKKHLEQGKNENWLCLPTEKISDLNLIRRYLFLSGLMPCVKFLNPLVS